MSAVAVRGLAVPYGQRGVAFDRHGRQFYETIMPGAFRAAVEKRAKQGLGEIKMLLKHKGYPMASTKSGTLDVSENDKGVHIRAELDPQNPDSARVISAAQRGDARSMSVGMRVLKDEWKTLGGRQHRIVHEADIEEVSAADKPSYLGTSLSVEQQQADDAARVRLAELALKARGGTPAEMAA